MSPKFEDDKMDTLERYEANPFKEGTPEYSMYERITEILVRGALRTATRAMAFETRHSAENICSLCGKAISDGGKHNCDHYE